MDELEARRGGDGVGGRRLARLRQAPRQRLLTLVKGAGEAIRDIVTEGGARHDEAPRADRRERRVEPRVDASGYAHRLEKGVLRQDPLDPVSVGHDTGAVARAVEVDGVEVTLLIEAEAVEHIAGEDHEPGTPRAKGDGLAPEVGDRAIRAVGPDDEHAGRRVHRKQDRQLRRWPADAGERFVDDLA